MKNTELILLYGLPYVVVATILGTLFGAAVYVWETKRGNPNVQSVVKPTAFVLGAVWPLTVILFLLYFPLKFLFWNTVGFLQAQEKEEKTDA